MTQYTRWPSSAPSILSVSESVSFSAESSKEFEIDISGNSVLVANGRLYIDANPGAGFFDVATLYFYSHSDRKDDQILFMATVPVIYTTFSADTASPASIIPATDASHFVAPDLMHLFGAASEFRRIASIAGNSITIMNTTVEDYLTGNGISNVAEFGNLVLYDLLASQKIWGKLVFPAAKTVSMKLDLVLRS